MAWNDETPAPPPEPPRLTYEAPPATPYATPADALAACEAENATLHTVVAQLQAQVADLQPKPEPVVQEYPKWVSADGEPDLIVNSEAEYEALVKAHPGYADRKDT